MAKRQDQGQHEGLSRSFEKMDSEVAESVLRDSLRGNEEPANEKDKPLNFHSTDPVDEGHLRHFLRQLANLCHLRGDMIPKAQEFLFRKFLLNRRDRHHLLQMSHAHALRSEEALNHGNTKLALLERLESWRKMPRDLSLLLDVVEAYIEPKSFTEERSLKDTSLVTEEIAGKKTAKKTEEDSERKSEESTRKKTETKEQKSSSSKEKKSRWLGFRGWGKEQREQRKALLREKKRFRKQEKEKKQASRKQQEKTARQLFKLSSRQYRRQALSYLKKSVELFIGLKDEENSQVAKGILAQELGRLQKLQQNYSNINWERYTKRLSALKGRPRKCWPWVFLVLLLLALFFTAMIYLSGRNWFRSTKPVSSRGKLPELSEQALLDSPVPVEWSMPPEKDQSFDKVIQKSHRLKLNQHYVYEVQGQIRVKPTDTGELSEHWQRLRPTESFDLLLTYEYQGQEIKKWVEFSYNNEADPNEVDRSPIMEGDTVLFREVFWLPNGPANGDRLLAKVIKVGKEPKSRVLGLNEGGFAQRLNSVNMQGNLVPTVEMAFRDKVMRSNGEKVQLLGYDIELQNNSKEPLEQYELRLNWRQEDGIRTQSNSPLLLQRDYTIISASGTNLPGQARMTQRLWLKVPEDLNYPVEKLTPQVRILKNRFLSK